MVVEINGHMLLAKQSAFQTVNATPEVALGYIECDIPDVPEKDVHTDSGNIYEQEATPGVNDAKWLAHIPARLSGGLGRLLHAAMGSDTLTNNGDSTYSHKLLSADSPPYLTIWRPFGTYTTYQKRLTGGAVEETAIRFANGAVTVEAKGPGYKPDIIASVGEPTASILAPVSAKMGLTATIDGVTVKPLSAEFVIKRNRDDKDFPSGSILRDTCESRKFQLTWKADFKFATLDWMRKQWGASDATTPSTTIYKFVVSFLIEGIVIGSGSRKESLLIYIPVSIFEGDTGIKGGANESVSFQLQGRAIVTDTSTDKPYITLTNTDATDYDA